MLDNHINFLNRVSVNAAIKLKKNVREYLIILKHFPKIGQKISLNKKNLFQLRRLVINKRYILIYFIVKNNIFIDAILDSRQKNNNYLT